MIATVMSWTRIDRIIISTAPVGIVLRLRRSKRERERERERERRNPCIVVAMSFGLSNTGHELNIAGQRTPHLQRCWKV